MRLRHLVRAQAVAAGAASFILAQSSHAEDIQTRIARNETVTSRPHPETDQLGIRLGAFMLDPDAVAGTGYTDNVYAAHSGAQADEVNNFATKFDLHSDWSSNSLSLTATDSQSIHVRHGAENANDYGLTAKGRLDVTQDDRLSFDTFYSLAHEPRSSPDNVFGKTPTHYSSEHVGLGSFDKFNRVSLNVDANTVKYEYADVPTSLGSFIGEHDRDRWESSASVRLGYEILPEYEAVLRAGYDDRSYIHPRDKSGFARSSQGETVTAGLAIDLTGVTFGEIGVGFLDRRYQDPRFSSLQGLSARISLTWNATPLMSVKFDGSRSVDETVVVGSSGVVDTAGSVTIDHEVLRNLLLNAKIGLIGAHYRNIRQQNVTLTSGFGVTYLYNRYMHMSAKFNRTNSDSTNQLNAFTQNIVSLSLTLQL